jgi:hypothetical protein
MGRRKNMAGSTGHRIREARFVQHQIIACAVAMAGNVKSLSYAGNAR